ncbi:hypothetical protein DEO72_LG6g1530 [Vigna unguiculata]|uniref:Uncharacterized protein n=1 Tax=Vigna unguiculata TaxID=3917 RepID=A0A4D6M811_VIGUN|nr:hypothetical protein DEO72_LG6g1530 [Vigna unguiculata]
MKFQFREFLSLFYGMFEQIMDVVSTSRLAPDATNKSISCPTYFLSTFHNQNK